MKKNLTAKLFGVALASALSLAALTGCATTAGQPAQPGASLPSQSAQPVSAGAVLLSINPEITISYDRAGNVLTLRGLNQEGRDVVAGYADYAGQPCQTVVGELVAQIQTQGYFENTIDGHQRNIVLKLEHGSDLPSDQFLDELADAVRTVVSSGNLGSQTVALDENDLDQSNAQKGYINAQAAQDILSAQLGRNDLQFVEKEYDLDDGDYEVEFVLDGVEYEYEVDAYTGKVTEVEMDRQDDVYDDDWDDQYDDIYDDDWDDRYDDIYDDDWDDRYDDIYDDDWDDRYDDIYDDDWDDQYDDIYDDDWDDQYDDIYDDDWDDRYDDIYDDDWDDRYDDIYDDDWDDQYDDYYDDDWDDQYDDYYDDDWDDRYDDYYDDDWDDDYDDDWDDDWDDDDDDDWDDDWDD